ncbi:hypothetical protein Pmar_PMAR019942 [Perkinsus marinus ATCC 50983]|uniref:Uncharacterized protein n=1 Tax=Perkinsus marinus (strain ATCC 50983 / TXsc) TaxID=423536 RepID=C5KC29_PERM5|nr:hypothetical protein Pmar_PMAR019942 [Perkinsus marinus ATCC 50983]EER18060.1 hypothetical protein Pmar_PMAR019942 [Perkinsus marinus ATCC 50983]|eukprot:XP_002786264.1 hypothetical protein Pmar_PMAR019942 [Perkinsus marinus ATCC 50983]
MRKERDLTRKFEGRVAELVAECKSLEANYNELGESKKDVESELLFAKKEKEGSDSKLQALRAVTEGELKNLRTELARERLRWAKEILPQNLSVIMREVEFLYDQSQRDVAQVRGLRRIIALVGRYLGQLLPKGTVDLRVFVSNDDVDEGGAIWRAIHCAFGGLENIKLASEEKETRLAKMEETMESMLQ